MSGTTRVFDHVTAPAPRFLMRASLLQQIVDSLPPDLSNFLEIGPGSGDVSCFLAARYAAAKGLLVEIASSSTDVLRRRVSGSPQLTVEHVDFRELTRSGDYDLVVACEVFEHIEDDESAFEAVNGLLRPGGAFVFSVPAFMRRWGAADVYAGHIRRYERSEIADKFARHGFQIDTLWCYGFPLTYITNPLSNYYYRRKNKNEPADQREATMRSGSERNVVKRLSFLPIAKILTPLFALQNLVKRSDYGDGYIVLAHKIS